MSMKKKKKNESQSFADFTNAYLGKKSNDIAPVRLTEQEQQMASSGGKKWYQEFFKGSSLFDDGYQFGDVSKAAGASVADLGVDILKGAGRLAEGVTDLVGHGVAGVADFIGQEEWADSFRDDVTKSWVDEVAAPTDEYLNNYSVLGSTSDAVGEGLGQVAAIILTGGALGAAGVGSAGITAATTGLIGASSMGSGMSEAYLGGATDKDALKYGALKGAIDAGTELIFGGLGKTVKSLGLSHGLTSLDDMLAKGLSSKISNRILQNLTELGVKASAEGLEEVLAGWGTAVAKKFTYMSEEELSTLIQDEDLLEQFIVGAVTSGIAQSGLVPGTRKGSFIDTVKKDQDFVTRLDYTEEAVINKVYNDRVLEAEQDGKKLSAKEQNQIYEDVLNDLEKGRIDTDAIEAVWGGGGAATEMMVKGTKLAESYNEKARRGQAFQANVTQYAANQRDTIQKAIASGVLNNTNRTHEFVDLIAKISADKGVSFDFTNNKKLKESGFAINGADVNAYINKDGITLNIDSHKAWQSTVGHEITHVLEGTELYAEMQRVLFDYAKSKGDYQGRYDSLIKLYKGVKGANIDAELTADLVGDYLFTDENFVKHLSSQNRNIFQKIYDEIKYLWKLVTAGSKEARDLERVKRAFDKAYKESGNVSTDTKYSISKANKDYLSALKRGDNETAQQMVDDAAENAGYNLQMYYQPDGKDIRVWCDIEGKQREAIVHSLHGTPYGIPTEMIDENRRFGDNAHLTLYVKAKNTFIIDNRAEVKKYLPDLLPYYDEMARIDEKYSALTKELGDAETDLLNKWGNEHYQGDYPDLDYLPIVERLSEGKPGINSPEYLTAYNERARVMEEWKTESNKIAAKCKEIITELLRNNGYDSIYFKGDSSKPDNFILLDANQIKSGDTVAYDNNGKYISLSKRFNTGKNDIRYSLSADNENVKTLDGGSVTKYSLSTWTPDTQAQVRKNLIRAGYAPRIVDKWIKDTNSVASVIAADKDRLDFEAADNQVMLKDNQDYIKTLDASTLCAKRLVYQGTFNAIQHRMPNTVLSSDDLIDLLNMMKESGVQTPCGVCYVESRRRHLGKFAQEWLNSYNGEYKPRLDEVTTSDGLEKLRKRHPQTYRDFVGAMNKKGSSNPKVVQLRTAYRNDIMSLTPSQIRNIEAIGGLRVQSFSDFETPHMLDMMQAVMDMAAKGLHSQAYTKVPNFAWVFGDTGMKINLSLIAEGNGFDSKGNLAFSSTEGMDIKEAMMLRNAYSENVGTIIVGANDKHILACMADDRIDFIIPFHRSGWGMKELDMMGMSSYTDYSYGQNEHDLSTGKRVKENLYPPNYWDYTLTGKANAERYLQLCAETGREPKFSKFLVNNGDGSYSLQPDGSTDGYWKTLIDFKMYNNNGRGAPQQTVKPNFNMREAYRVLNEYEGGANELPVANDIAEKFVARYKKSKKRAPTMSISAKGDPQKRYGNYYTPLKELKIDKSIKKSIEGTNTQALINRNMVNANKEEELIAPIADDYAPVGNIGGNVTKNVVDDQNGAKKKRGFIDGLKKSTTKARTHLVDNYSVFEDLALKTGNRELDAKANFMRYSEQRAQHFIGHGADGVRALEDLRKEVKASGLDQEFQEYMYDMHNTDRMSLEKRAKSMLRKFSKQFKELKPERVKAIAAKSITAQTTAKTAQTIRDARQYLNLLELRNKPVRGEHYTAEISQANAARLEALHPQFKEWAQDIYKINDYLRAKLVEDGEISQETADLWAEIYPHYVPIRRLDNSGAAVGEQYIQQTGLTGHLDEGNNTGVNAPIKRATGGSSDIDDLFRTLAMRAEQTYKAGAKNRFGLELKDTLATTINRRQASFDEMVDGVETHEERLKKGENGTKSTFTVFENGERVEFEITDEMYEALQPANDLFSGTNKVLNAATKFQRGVLTQYNPFFTLRNIVKDAQDVFINSQHAAKTYAKMPTAISELAKHARGASTKWAKEYFENGGEQNTYFDGQELTFKKEDSTWKKVLGFVPRKISEISNFVERAPRLAEYIASREAGKSIEGAMLDSARVTTNFAAGGDVTKWANRNGFTFLNASIQGAAQQVRNVREAKANGLKGMLKLGAKFVAAGLPFVLLNSLMWDDDDDYEELSDYVKENYYIVAKYGDGQFVRIPKGRAMAVIQNAFEQMGNLITGDDEVDLERFGQLLVENLAPNNPLENNVFAPVMDAFDNKTWYGDDLVPTRLQDLPAAEQYDETTDSISKWIGENTDTSPYKWNYLLDQYSGVFGDMFLPMLTPQAERGDNSLAGNLIAPLKDQFTTDSVLKNQNVSDFYDTVDELAKNANSSYATDDDILKYKYMNSVNADLSELYKQKREIQNSNLADAEKYEAVREIQKQIDELTEESLNTYGNVNIDGVYATVGNSHFRWYEPSGDSEAEPGWQKISDTQLAKQQEVTSGLGISPATYWNNKSEYDFAYEYPGRYGIAKSVGGYENYKYYASDLYDIKADKDANGKTITGSRKEKVADYINGLDISYEEKIILFKSEYNSDDTYNHEIINYLSNREDISYEEMVAILQELGFTVKGNTVTWD